MKNISATALAAAAALSLPATAFAAPPLGGAGVRPPVSVPGGAVNVPPVQLPSTGSAPVQPSVNGSASGSASAGAGVNRTNASLTGNTAASASSVGKVTAVTGSTLTLTLPNGTSKTFKVSASAFGQNKPKLGQRLAVAADAQGNATSIMVADQSIRATVASVAKNGVTLKLPNGRTVTMNVASQAVAHMHLTPGQHVTLTTHDGGQTSVISKR
ncbi:MAG TPA: hypothetical protein VFL13_00945 [Candidatus Baltobacteraceae bacterium]|nr:hypothetical protein [Candidatus Baltobacteraceae bacterium]